MGRLNLKRIDPELVQDIKDINYIGLYKTVASCSGHGKYHSTIVVLSLFGNYSEYYSCVQIHPKKRRYLCFYSRDAEGFYYIPAVEDFYKKRDD